MNRRFVTATLIFAALHYLSLHLLETIIYLLAHLPPRAVNLDPLIVVLSTFGQVLVFPRWILRHLWPGESTPAGLNLLFTILNSLTWGFALAAIRHRRNRRVD